MEDKVFLETIVKELVDKPEDVVVEREVDERGVLLTLKVQRQESLSTFKSTKTPAQENPENPIGSTAGES